jgi:hypothetical protein
MRELHFYAGDAEPTTCAPGQYGFKKDFDSRKYSYDSSITLEDTDGDGVWIIAHAVVCGDCK